MDEQTKIEVEAAAFRALLAHLDSRKDVQNIDMMILTGMCRNCLSRWYQEAANERGINMDKAEGREAVYGEPYADWVMKYQTDASPAQEAAFKLAFAQNVGDPAK